MYAKRHRNETYIFEKIIYKRPTDSPARLSECASTTYMSKENYVYEKRPIKKTHVYEKRPICMQR